MLNSHFSEKSLGLFSAPFLCMIFQKKNVSYVALTKFHGLIAFTSRDIGQYVY